MTKPRISATSIPILARIDRYIRECNMRGSMQRFHGAAADVCDGYCTRAEVDDLVRRRFLEVVVYSKWEVGCDIVWENRGLCGTSWSVNPTERLIRTFWPDRLF